MAPLRVGERAERGVDEAVIALDLLHAVEGGVEPDIVGDALERCHRDERADVVQHQPADRRARLARQHHADDAAHRGADIVDLVHVQARDQRRYAAQIDRIAVVGRDRQPRALAASGHVGGGDRTVQSQAFAQQVKIARVARQAMDADRRPAACPRGGRPIAIGQLVEAMEAEARQPL